MDRIGVVGISYRTTQVERLARAALPAEFPDESLVELARLSGFTEFVYLATCNRVEFYFRGESRIHTSELLFHLRRSLADLTDGRCQLPEEDELYVLFGRAAVRHLFRVASALDSMMVGEAQIAGQVKQAHEKAHSLGLLTGMLDQTVHEAFHLAKRIRTETELTRRPVSLVTLVERTIHDRLEVDDAPVLVMGAGEMARQAIRLVRAADPQRRLIVANRSVARARRLIGSDAAGEAVGLDEVRERPPAAGLVVTATSAADILLDRDRVSAIRRRLPSAAPLVLVDLAMPPNVDPACAELGRDVVLHGIEQMRAEAEANRQRRLQEIDRCESLVEHQLTVLRRRALDRELSPAAASLQRSFREMAARALEHSLARELSHLSDDDRKAVTRMTEGLVKRLVQVPLRGLKGAAWHHSAAVIDGFVQGLDEKAGAPEAR